MESKEEDLHKTDSSSQKSNLDFSFEPCDFFDKNVIEEYASFIQNSQENQDSGPGSSTVSRQPVSVDLRKNLRLSDWIQKNDGEVAQNSASALDIIKKRKFLASEDSENDGILSAKYQDRGSMVKRFQEAVSSWERDKADENEDERPGGSRMNDLEAMRLRAQMYDETYCQPKDPSKNYSQLMYKKAALPPNAIASLYGCSKKSLGGVVKQDFKIPVAAATVFRNAGQHDERLSKRDDGRPDLRMYFDEDSSTNRQKDQFWSKDSETPSSAVPFEHDRSKLTSNDNKSKQENDASSHLEALIESEILQLKNVVSWDDLAGLDKEKASIKELVVWPMLRPDLFQGIRAPPRGLLLYGPPGTGKTLVGRCVASQARATFFNVSAASLTSKWLGESEKLVRALFVVAKRRAPAVVFLDEVDSLMSQRADGENDATRRIKNEFLQQLDGTTSESGDRILLIGATNRPHELDAAARRRFVRRIYIPLPNSTARFQIIDRLLKEQRHSLTDDQKHALADRTENYSCADVTNLCKEAALGPLRSVENIETVASDDIPPVTFDHFELALTAVGPTVNEKDIEICKNFHLEFGYNK